MKWERPANVPFPSVWHTFKAKDLESDAIINYRVQDLPVDYYPRALDLMKLDFLKDEAMCSAVALAKDEVSCKEIMELWESMFKQKMVLACFRENSDDLVGMNMVMVQTKDEKDDIESKITGEKWKAVYGAVKEVTKRVDVFEKYNVDKYLTALGLSVDTKYRGQGIGTEILKARIPLCRATNVPLTSTVFTGIASQKNAAKAGFVDDVEVEYAELCRMGYDFATIKSKSVKVMSKVVD